MDNQAQFFISTIQHNSQKICCYIHFTFHMVLTCIQNLRYFHTIVEARTHAGLHAGLTPIPSVLIACSQLTLAACSVWPQQNHQKPLCWFVLVVKVNTIWCQHRVFYYENQLDTLIGFSAQLLAYLI